MKTTRPATLARLALGIGLGTIALGWAAPAFGAGGPPGNNGTVKVDGVAFDSHPDNEPHVGCTFEIDFYGFDQGDLHAQVTFEVQPPTGDQVILTDSVFIGEDDNSGGGSEAGLDASKQYDLTSLLVGAFTPQPQQGYHVKLTVDAQGSQGADTKHKTFWVDGCESPVSPTTEPPTTEAPTTAPPTTQGGGADVSATVTTPEGAQVLGESISRDPLPRTGIDSGLWAALGSGLLTSGGAVTVLSRKLRHKS